MTRDLSPGQKVLIRAVMGQNIVDDMPTLVTTSGGTWLATPAEIVIPPTESEIRTAIDKATGLMSEAGASGYALGYRHCLADVFGEPHDHL